MRHDPNSLMVFAAGLGTRMGVLTRHRPKPLIQVAGKALIDHALDIAEPSALETVVVNAHYHADQLATHLRDTPARISFERERLLDTGGGLKHARSLLGSSTVFTLNADAVWTGPNPLEELRSAWQPERMDALLLLLRPMDATGSQGPGDFNMDTEGRLARGTDLVYSGAQIIKMETLESIKEDVFSLNRVWNEISRAGRLFGTLHGGGWCDVGHPGGIAEADALLADDSV